MIVSRCNLIVERANRKTLVVRFGTPDLRESVDPQGDSCELFEELRVAALDALEEGQTLVLNFALIEPFPSAFYSCLLKVREVVLARGARLILCRLGPAVEEAIKLFKGDRLFLVARSEARALRDPWRVA